jgi:hypothetical protein
MVFKLNDVLAGTRAGIGVHTPDSAQLFAGLPFLDIVASSQELVNDRMPLNGRRSNWADLLI